MLYVSILQDKSIIFFCIKISIIFAYKFYQKRIAVSFNWNVAIKKSDRIH